MKGPKFLRPENYQSIIVNFKIVIIDYTLLFNIM